MTASEEKWTKILGAALVIAIVGLVVVTGRARAKIHAHASIPIACAKVCGAACERDKACGGFKGDCELSCTARCAGATIRFEDPDGCIRAMHALSCAEAEKMGNGDDSVGGAACARQ